jgi:hypothetical protein
MPALRDTYAFFIVIFIFVFYYYLYKCLFFGYLFFQIFCSGFVLLSTHSGGRRLKSAKAGNRGGWGTGGAAGSMGIWPRGAAREGMAAVAGPVGLAQRLGGRAGMNE